MTAFRPGPSSAPVPARSLLLMMSPSLRQLVCLLILSCALAADASWADPVSTVQLLRVSGCGGISAATQPLQRNPQLARAAVLWAGGSSPGSAAARSGYQAQLTVGLHLSGPDDSILQSLRRTHCRALAEKSLRDFGVYRQGRETWVVIAAPTIVPSAAGMAASAARVLQLVNEVRAAGSRCGDKSFGPAPPLQRSGTLDDAAAEHAADMARHDYFEHVDLQGKTPADRVRAAGYRGKLVGENIAYGPNTAQEVMSGWLHSPGHCANIMDPRFTEMGLATALGRGSRRGLYWDQELAQPAK